jgi:hypothetical protein
MGSGSMHLDRAIDRVAKSKRTGPSTSLVARRVEPPARRVVRELQRSAGNRAVTQLLAREFIGRHDAPMYANNQDDQVALTVPRYTRVTVSYTATRAKRRTFAEIGKGYAKRPPSQPPRDTREEQKSEQEPAAEEAKKGPDVVEWGPFQRAPSPAPQEEKEREQEPEKEAKKEEDVVEWGPFVSAPSPVSTPKGNYSTFERQHYGRMGWLDPSAVVKEFPAARLDPGDVLHTIPPLFHGTDEAAAASIRREGFRLKETPTVGRSFGNGIYATPYLATAAGHGFGAALTPPKTGFAVGAVKTLKPIQSPRILVHDVALEDRLVGELKRLPRAKDRRERVAREREVLAKLLPGEVVAVAVQLARIESVTRAEQSHTSPPNPDELSIDRVDITEAARKLGYDVVVYAGRPPDIVYVFLDAPKWTIGDIVLQGKVGAGDEGVDIQDLDWYHAATDLDIKREAEQSKRK